MASTLNAFLDRYRKAFAADDVAGLVELVHLPCLVMGPTVHALTTPQELQESLARQLERHKEAGVVEARFKVLGHRRLEARTLTADVSWQMHDEDGGIVADFALMYTLTAPERGWKIVAVAPLELGLLAANPTGAHTIPESVYRKR